MFMFNHVYDAVVHCGIRSLIIRAFSFAGMFSNSLYYCFRCIPKAVEKLEDGKLKVTWQNEKEEQFNDVFDTVLFAIGRRALTRELHLDKTGVKVAGDGEKIDAANEQTNVAHIFAVGDVLYKKPELTPVAIHAGKLLARRLFGGSNLEMDYDNVATTVFSPLEYGAVGLSEETAVARFGADEIEVYHGYYKPTEFFIPQKNISHCYLKVISKRNGDQKVLGMHFVGPNAGEVIQGFAAAIK